MGDGVDSVHGPGVEHPSPGRLAKRAGTVQRQGHIGDVQAEILVQVFDPKGHQINADVASAVPVDYEYPRAVPAIAVAQNPTGGLVDPGTVQPPLASRFVGVWFKAAIKAEAFEWEPSKRRRLQCHIRGRRWLLVVAARILDPSLLVKEQPSFGEFFTETAPERTIRDSQPTPRKFGLHRPFV